MGTFELWTLDCVHAEIVQTV